MSDRLPLMAAGSFAGLRLGHYAAVLADPPWRFKMWSAKGMNRNPDFIMTRNQQRQNKPERHYATMSLADIAKLPVASVTSPDAVLFLWAIDPMIPEAIEIGRAWGFQFKTVAFYWAKLRREGSTRHLLHDEPDYKLFPMGTGYWTRPNPEQCLLFTRGAPKRLSAAVRKLIIAPRREHSRKPDAAHDRIERLVAGPYLELFARTARPGWTIWGDEAPGWQNDDMKKSIGVAFDAVRERVAVGGKPWTPKAGSDHA